MNRRSFLIYVPSVALCCTQYSWASDFLDPEDWEPSGKPSIKPVDPDDVPGGSHEEAKTYLCSFNSSISMGHHQARPMACPGTNWSDPYAQILMRVIDYLNHRPDHYVVGPKPGSRNATAYFCGVGEYRRKAIDWDPQFLWELSRRAGTPHAATAVLFHELGHHINADMSLRTGPDRELWADSFAGFHLAKGGIPQREAVAVFSLMGGGGGTHPPAQQRVAAAAAGWQKGMMQKRSGY